MDKTTLISRLAEIGTCEDDVNRRELIAQLQEEAEADYDRLSELETTNNQLTSDNEDLRSANMKLFLRIGDHKQTDDLDKDKADKREFKNLFNEKGCIK